MPHTRRALTISRLEIRVSHRTRIPFTLPTDFASHWSIFRGFLPRRRRDRRSLNARRLVAIVVVDAFLATISATAAGEGEVQGIGSGRVGVGARFGKTSNPNPAELRPSDNGGYGGGYGERYLLN